MYTLSPHPPQNAPASAALSGDPVSRHCVGSATIYRADALVALQRMESNSLDAIVTDPPYGLSKEPDIVEVLTHWIKGDDYVHTSKGFMGTTWDSFVPGPAIWSEALRVLKPGGYAAVFASTRTYDLMVIALRMAGFQVVDTLMWVNAQGFPKSLNISRLLEKAGEANLASQFAGYGNALKPAHEPIALVRKPLEGRYVDNVSLYGTGVLNIDARRIKNTDPDARGREGEDSAERRYTANGGTNFAATPGVRGGSPEGRYPSNLLFQHDPACVVVEHHAVGTVDTPGTYACVLGCPVRELDNQSGVRTSGKPGTYRGTPNRSAAYGAESRKAGEAMTGYGDSGGASRFYPNFSYAKKATQKERLTVHVPAQGCVKDGHVVDPHHPDTIYGEGVTMVANGAVAPTCVRCGTEWVPYQHPTVKPLGIMEWLVGLLTPTGGTVLDLFAGTGTTGVVAMQGGFDCVLVERDPVHAFMAVQRSAIVAAALHDHSQSNGTDDGANDGQGTLFE